MNIIETVVTTEIVFSVINKSDERYPVGRDALDKCWLWVESGAVTGDELYELIDNADYTGISEYMEEEENLNIALMWSLLVDTVAYTAWAAYKREEVKYLPQALEGFAADSITIILNSAVENDLILIEEAEQMKLALTVTNFTDTDKVDRQDFLKLIFS